MADMSTVFLMIEFLGQQYRQEVKPGMADFWHSALEGYTKDELRQAAADWVRSNKFFPTLAELLPLLDNAARGRRAAEEQRIMYWQAMSLYNGALSGRTPDGYLDTDRAYGWYSRTRKPDAEVDE